MTTSTFPVSHVRSESAYAPLRVLIYEKEGKTRIEYDLRRFHPQSADADNTHRAMVQSAK